MAGRSFRFSLSPVLQLRERAVESAREALGAARADRRGAETALAEVEAAVATHREMSSGRTARSLQAAAVHRERLGRACTEAEQALDRLRHAERQTQHALAEAVRGREALAVLRDEAADAHRADALRQETAALDDIALAGRRRAVATASARS